MSDVRLTSQKAQPCAAEKEGSGDGGGMVKSNSEGLAQIGRRSLWRWLDDQVEDDDKQSSGWNRWREEPGRNGQKKEPGWNRRRSQEQEEMGDGRHFRVQPGRRPMVELMEGGATVEEGLTTPGGRASERRAQGSDGQPQSQGDAKDPEGQGRADDSGDRGANGNPKGHSRAGVTEDQGGAGGTEKPNRVRGMEGQGETRGK
ncbi:hypothetical protein H4Q32_000150 [Labeo rohita]|uniref:Uncharacterized protein n=1 Tax=Labeo rohita TaxID=84645 RepID=A0ABQ8LHR4_LABRO|nr:hypothetical protein H4Q32_000150 [Labeo rohita]